MPARKATGVGDRVLVEDCMAFVREYRQIVSHLDKAEIDQLAQMIGVGRHQSPLCFDVSKRPNEVDRSKGIDPRYATSRVFIH